MKVNANLLNLVAAVFCLFLFRPSSTAQEIKVTYQERMKSDAVLNQIEDAEIAALVQTQLSQQTKSMSLLYSNGKSIYQAEELPKSGSNNLSVYKDFGSKEILAQEMILDRLFLVKEELVKPNWTLINEDLEILGYSCKKALNEQGVVAWYCPELSISDGPSLYYGLPGLILKVDSPANKEYIATSLDTQYIAMEQIKAPSKGTKISRKKFRETQKKKLKNLGGEAKNGVRIIKM